MTAPAIVIRLELEAAPSVMCDWLDDGDERRMLDWLHAHPELLELVDRALTAAHDAQDRRAA